MDTNDNDEELLEINRVISTYKNALKTSLKEVLEKDLAMQIQLNGYLSRLREKNNLALNALKQCLYRAKGYKQIETELPDTLIQPSNDSLALKLEFIRYKLAKLYAKVLGNSSNNEQDKTIYARTISFIHKLFDANKNNDQTIQGQFLDLLSNALEKKELVNFDIFNEAYGLILNWIERLFYQKKLNFILDKISQWDETEETEPLSEETILNIKIIFYKIIFELDIKLMYKHLLDQLYELIKNELSPSFMLRKFIDSFVRLCIEDIDMTDSDLDLAIRLLYQAAEHMHAEAQDKLTGKLSSFFKKITGIKSLPIDFIREYKQKTGNDLKDQMNNFQCTPVSQCSIKKDGNNNNEIDHYFPIETIQSYCSKNIQKNIDAALKEIKLLYPLDTIKTEKQPLLSEQFKKITKKTMVLCKEIHQKVTDNIHTPSKEAINDFVTHTKHKFKSQSPFIEPPSTHKINTEKGEVIIYGVIENIKANKTTYDIKLLREKLVLLIKSLTLLSQEFSLFLSMDVTIKEVTPTNNKKDTSQFLANGILFKLHHLKRILNLLKENIVSLFSTSRPIEENNTNIENSYQLNKLSSTSLSSLTEMAEDLSKGIDKYCLEYHPKKLQDNLIKTVKKVKEEKYWFGQPLKSVWDLIKRMLQRGYLNEKRVIKKLKFRLKDEINFEKEKEFFKKKNFWTLLNYGVIRWPWFNQEEFSHNWAEQLIFLKATPVIEEAETSQSISKKLFEKIFLLCKGLALAKNLTFKGFEKFNKIDDFYQKLKQDIKEYQLVVYSLIEILDKFTPGETNLAPTRSNNNNFFYNKNEQNTLITSSDSTSPIISFG